MRPVASRTMVPGSGATLRLEQVTDPLFEPTVAPGRTPRDWLQFKPAGDPWSLMAICAPENAVCAWAKVPIELPKVNAKVREAPPTSALLVPFVVIAPNSFSSNPNPLNPLLLALYCQPVTAAMLAGSVTVTFPTAISVIALLALLAGAFWEVLVKNSEKWVASMYVPVQEAQNRNVLPEQPDPVKRVCASAALGAIPRMAARAPYPMRLSMESPTL